MKKKLLILSLLPLFTLTSCVIAPAYAAGNSEKVYTIPPYTPPTPPAEPKNIASIDILGIPEDYKIGMGLFNEANIRCQITYTDESSNSFQLFEETLPYEIREMLGVEGEHTVTIQIRNQTVSFKIIMVDEGIRYLVRFLNYNDDVLEMKEVLPNNKVQYTGDEPHRMSDIVYKYNHNGWDHDLDTYLVDKSTDIYALYDQTFKYNDYLPMQAAPQLIDEYKAINPVTSFENNFVSYYVGRITNIPIARYYGNEYTVHTKGHKEQIDYAFDDTDSPIDPDILDQKYDYHPDITYTLSGAIRGSYKYVDPSGSIDPKYIPAGAELINLAQIEDTSFELQSIRSRNVEGKTYNTVVNNYKDVVTDYLSTGKIGTLNIPEDFEDGKYCATLFVDIDVYAYVYAERRPTSINNSPIYAISCISDIYVGINNYDYRAIPFNYSSSTYEEDKMGVEIFASMMEYARSAYEE